MRSAWVKIFIRYYWAVSATTHLPLPFAPVEQLELPHPPNWLYPISVFHPLRQQWTDILWPELRRPPPENSSYWMWKESPCPWVYIHSHSGKLVLRTTIPSILLYSTRHSLKHIIELHWHIIVNWYLYFYITDFGVCIQLNWSGVLQSFFHCLMCGGYLVLLILI